MLVNNGETSSPISSVLDCHETRFLYLYPIGSPYLFVTYITTKVIKCSYISIPYCTWISCVFTYHCKGPINFLMGKISPKNSQPSDPTPLEMAPGNPTWQPESTKKHRGHVEKNSPGQFDEIQLPCFDQYMCVRSGRVDQLP